MRHPVQTLGSSSFLLYTCESAFFFLLEGNTFLGDPSGHKQGRKFTTQGHTTPRCDVNQQWGEDAVFFGSVPFPRDKRSFLK